MEEYSERRFGNSVQTDFQLSKMPLVQNKGFYPALTQFARSLFYGERSGHSRLASCSSAISSVLKITGKMAADQVFLIQLSGDLTKESYEYFQMEAWKLLDRNCRYVILDLANVRLMDAAGLASLQGFQEKIRKDNRKLCLAGLRTEPLLLFNIKKAYPDFSLYDGVPLAVQECCRQTV